MSAARKNRMFKGQSIPTGVNEWASFLKRVLGEQRELCRSLEAMCERQAMLVRQGDSDGLMRLLSQRQALVDRIGELSDQVVPFRESWEARMAGVSASERRELEAAVGEITSLIERIGKHDDADRAALESQRETLSKELTTVNRGQGALGAYSEAAGMGASGPRFQDCNG